MSPTFQALGIDRLDVEQRLALVQEIWDSIAKKKLLRSSHRRAAKGNRPSLEPLTK